MAATRKKTRTTNCSDRTAAYAEAVVAGEIVAGRKQTGSTSIEIIYDSVDHEELEELHKTGAVVNWLVTAPLSETEGVPKPAAVGGTITPPTTVLSKQFNGFVQNFAVTSQDNDVWKATITIRGSGAVATHRPTGP